MATSKKIKAVICKCKIIDDRVLLLRMKPQKRVPNFNPGQFLHLTLDKYDPCEQWPESRVFSIAISPETRMEKIEIIISKQGKYTNRIFEEIQLGREIWLKLPYGDFTLNDRLGENNIFIAGGTGISPFLSILKSNVSKDQKIRLYYGIKNSRYFVDKNFLLDKINSDFNFKLEVFIENSDDNQYLDGALNIEYIYNQNRTPKSNYFISGPKEMIDTFSNYLLHQRIDEERIIVDSWD
ncbi:FAD-dependent oxidoreductase [bacterium]|nr:MAG: FAD-dependent oxidoreductase [bacterium]